MSLYAGKSRCKLKFEGESWIICLGTVGRQCEDPGRRRLFCGD